MTKKWLYFTDIVTVALGGKKILRGKSFLANFGHLNPCHQWREQPTGMSIDKNETIDYGGDVVTPLFVKIIPIHTTIFGAIE